MTGKLGAYWSDLRQEVTKGLMELLTKEKEKTEEELWEMLKKKELVGAARVHLTQNQCTLKSLLI